MTKTSYLVVPSKGLEKTHKICVKDETTHFRRNWTMFFTFLFLTLLGACVLGVGVSLLAQASNWAEIGTGIFTMVAASPLIVFSIVKTEENWAPYKVTDYAHRWYESYLGLAWRPRGCKEEGLLNSDPNLNDILATWFCETDPEDEVLQWVDV